jgi:hypothetical protein
MQTKSPRTAAAIAGLGASSALLLQHYRPFGTGEWQDFGVGLVVGVSIAASISVMVKKRNAD